mgnify:CR=1 FL=1
MIDQTAALDLPNRKVVRKLYEAASAPLEKPLCLVAAEKIAMTCKGGDTVFIVTGFPVLPKNVGETDGPPGVAVLAETLRAVGLKPIMVTDDVCVDVVKAASSNVSVVTFPIDGKQARRMADNLLSKHEPSTLIAIERPGWNKRKEYHTMRGLNISSLVGKTDHLFKMGQRRGIATIAVGDGGNELGCGTIIRTVRRNVPYGAKCQCPCGAGIAASTPADVLVVGGTSNWAAYGIAACLSLLKKIEYKHDKESELKLLGRILDAGAVDSVTKESQPFVDGVPTSINSLVVHLIWAIANA